MNKEYLKEVDKKEVIDALCMLHSCSLKDKRYTTQKEQFKIVEYYIEKQEKIIDLILDKFLIGTKYYFSEFDYMNKEELKTYFEEMVENEQG